MKQRSKVVVVTVSARGIGLAYCERFAAHDYGVVIADKLDDESMRAAESICENGPEQ